MINPIQATSAAGRPSRLAWAAACWAFIFAVVHIMWAAGWYVGLDAEQARVAFAKPWFVAYNLAVIGLCVAAVPLALTLGMPRDGREPNSMLIAAAWVGTALLVLRATASLIQAAYLAATGQLVLRRLGIWEPWFYIGAVLFGVNLWRYWRLESRA